MGTVGSLVFKGLSSFSTDLQSILDRQTAIAQLPIKALQNQQTDNLSKKQALIALNPAVGSVGSAVTALGTLAANKGVVASTSDSSIVSIINTGATTPGSFTISNIQKLASVASETSLQGYSEAQAVSTAGQNTVDLQLGADTFHLDLAGNNTLAGLRDAINNSGAQVSASIFTVGGNNYLNLTANNTGETTLSLTDVAANPVNSVSLISQAATQGSDADFEVNGIHTTKSTNTINDIISGVSFTLNDTSVGSVNLSLQTSSTQLSSSLQAFVSSYNTLVDQVSAQVGVSTGVLSGESLVRNISDDLRQLTSYWNPSITGSIRSLSDLGVTFDTGGHLFFDSTAVSVLSGSQVSDAFKFLGSSSSGFAALAGNFKQLSDSVSGSIRIQEDGYDTQNSQLSDRISILSDRATQAQANLTAKLQNADALLAQLDSRKTILNSSIQSLDLLLYGKQTNSNGL